MGPEGKNQSVKNKWHLVKKEQIAVFYSSLLIRLVCTNVVFGKKKVEK